MPSPTYNVPVPEHEVPSEPQNQVAITKLREIVVTDHDLAVWNQWFGMFTLFFICFTCRYHTSTIPVKAAVTAPRLSNLTIVCAAGKWLFERERAMSTFRCLMIFDAIVCGLYVFNFISMLSNGSSAVVPMAIFGAYFGVGFFFALKMYKHMTSTRYTLLVSFKRLGNELSAHQQTIRMGPDIVEASDGTIVTDFTERIKVC